MVKQLVFFFLKGVGGLGRERENLLERTRISWLFEKGKKRKPSVGGVKQDYEIKIGKLNSIYIDKKASRWGIKTYNG